MLATSHALTGAILAIKIHNPYLAIAIAFISHPLLDLIPHWDFNSRRKNKNQHTFITISIVDSFLGMLIGLLLFGRAINPIILVAVMMAAQWADYLEAPFHFGWHFPPFTTIKNIQHHLHNKLPLPWGLLPQILILLLAILLSATS